MLAFINKYIKNIIFFILLFGCLLTLLFLFCLVIFGQFFFIGEDLFFMFTLYKINPILIKKLFFIPFFYFSPENITFSWFNFSFFISETFFFNDLVSALLFIGCVVFSCIFSLVSLSFFSSITFKNINVYSFIYLFLFCLFIYCFFLLISVYLVSPPLYNFRDSLIFRSPLPDSFFPDLVWGVPLINRSCVICYRDYSSELGELVDSAFYFFSRFYRPYGTFWYIHVLGEVIDLKRDCVQLLIKQSPFMANDIILDYVKNYSLARYHLFFRPFWLS